MDADIENAIWSLTEAAKDRVSPKIDAATIKLRSAIRLAIDAGSAPSLRDEFAKAALTGMLAESGGGYVELAEHAYKYADAMLAAREVKP